MAYIGPVWNVPLWAARASVKTGWSATEALSRFRAAGGAIRTSTFFEIYREAAAVAEAEPTEVGLALNRRPTQAELLPVTTRYETGYSHEVQVLLRATEDTAGYKAGDLKTSTVEVRTPQVLTRAQANRMAIAIAEANGEKYKDVVIGSIHTGSYELNPT